LGTTKQFLLSNRQTALNTYFTAFKGSA